MTLMIRYVAKSDVGMIREGNEDSGYAGPKLLAVADGMGGHAAGELASAVAIEELVLTEEKHKHGKDPLKSLGSAIQAAHKRIRKLVTDDHDREGMGTTVTALLWTGDGFGLVHIGDSRGYRLRDGDLEQITTDHTFVQSLVDEGRITQEQASMHPARSMILKALQGDIEPQADLELIDVRGGDRYLLCSDGLTDYVSTDPIEEVLLARQDRAEAADAIVQLALRTGAPDNVTVVVADVIDTDDPPGPDDTAEAYLVGAASDDPPPPPPAARLRPGDGVRPFVAGPSNDPAPDMDDTLVGTAVAAEGVEAGDDPDAGTDTAIDQSGDPEELRYAPRPPRRLRWLRWLAALIVLAGLAWAGAAIANDWVRSQYFVGEQGGDVAIYRGVSQNVGPFSLYEYIGKPAELPVGALPDYLRNRVADTIAVDNRSEAERIVGELLTEACAAQPEPPTVLDGVDPAETDQTGTGEPGDPGTEPDEGDAATATAITTVAYTGVAANNVDPDPEQPQTIAYPGLVCPEDQ